VNFFQVSSNDIDYEVQMSLCEVVELFQRLRTVLNPQDGVRHSGGPERLVTGHYQLTGPAQEPFTPFLVLVVLQRALELV